MEARNRMGSGVPVKLGWLLAAALLALPVMARAEHAGSRIDLSWRDAHGQRRAVDNIAMTCDTTADDTLFLTLEPAQDGSTFVGFSANLIFHAPQGDSLAAVWRTADQNPDAIEVLFDTDRNAAVAAPWPRGQSLNTWKYDATSGSGRLRLVFGTSRTGSVTRKGGRYVLARVILRHPAKGPRCDQPVCVEFQMAQINWDYGDDEDVIHGARFVSWNGRGACDGFVPAQGPAPWKPKTGDTKTK